MQIKQINASIAGAFAFALRLPPFIPYLNALTNICFRIIIRKVNNSKEDLKCLKKKPSLIITWS
jgi:hypothetical protein